MAKVRLLRRQAESLPTIPQVNEPKLLNAPFPLWCKSLRIKTDKGLKPFELFDWQSDFVDVVLRNPRIPITLLSSRQTGKTADLLAMMIWLALSREQFTGLLIHRKGEDARQLARRTKKLIPFDVKLSSDSLSLLEFAETGSSLHFRSSNHKQEDGAESAGRGLESVDVVIIEEASHTNNVKELLGVVGPCLTHSPLATVILVGTSGRRETYFYESLCSAYEGKEPLESVLKGIRQWELEPFQVKRSEDRIAVITNWRAIPKFAAEGIGEDGTPNYLKRIQREQDLTDSQIASEHELYFDSDETTTIFEYPLVKAAQQGIFEPPRFDGYYYAGVDGSGKPKTGRKGDYTVCCVVEKLEDCSIKLVKLYRKRGITFERRYAEISEILNAYNPLKVYVEANDGLGQTYEENLLAGCPGLEIDRYIQNEGRKALLVNKLVLALERKEISIPKSPAIDELLSFQQLDDGTMGAWGKDAHDDTVMALGMAVVAAGYNASSNSSGGWS
ncbi:MAG: terminase family protein [Cyanobacteria bacterium J06597_16]